MDESQREDIPHISIQENEILVWHFSKTEVRNAMFQMNHNLASGPDGFLDEFYQVFWNVIKEDLMALFHDFDRGSLPVTVWTTILLPKVAMENNRENYFFGPKKVLLSSLSLLEI